MLPNPNMPVLHFEEAEIVAKDLERCWIGLTGLDSIPSIETLTDVVQRVQRKAREVLADRDGAL